MLNRWDCNVVWCCCTFLKLEIRPFFLMCSIVFGLSCQYLMDIPSLTMQPTGHHLNAQVKCMAFRSVALWVPVVIKRTRMMIEVLTCCMLMNLIAWINSLDVTYWDDVSALCCLISGRHFMSVDCCVRVLELGNSAESKLDSIWLNFDSIQFIIVASLGAEAIYELWSAVNSLGLAVNAQSRKYKSKKTFHWASFFQLQLATCEVNRPLQMQIHRMRCCRAHLKRQDEVTMAESNPRWFWIRHIKSIWIDSPIRLIRIDYSQL